MRRPRRTPGSRDPCRWPQPRCSSCSRSEINSEVRFLRLLAAVGIGLAVLNVVGVAVATRGSPDASGRERSPQVPAAPALRGRARRAALALGRDRPARARRGADRCRLCAHRCGEATSFGEPRGARRNNAACRARLARLPVGGPARGILGQPHARGSRDRVPRRPRFSHNPDAADRTLARTRARSNGRPSPGP